MEVSDNLCVQLKLVEIEVLYALICHNKSDLANFTNISIKICCIPELEITIPPLYLQGEIFARVQQLLLSGCVRKKIQSTHWPLQ
jgi:hypothetical protein